MLGLVTGLLRSDEPGGSARTQGYHPNQCNGTTTQKVQVAEAWQLLGGRSSAATTNSRRRDMRSIRPLRVSGGFS
jgi:hypothetical protein